MRVKGGSILCDGGCGDTIYDNTLALTCKCKKTHLCYYCVGELLYHYEEDGLIGDSCKHCGRQKIREGDEIKFTNKIKGLKSIGARW